MYGFIHCCLEDMVLQLFGEPAWREILNISGIKLRGASFLMHQVYDDEMTFKLVKAASDVSGLPVEVCLEEFGKHFLVYCQKNGYDQILRVLGSNLYDFLTNLDNLHDHLASIYPGMRAPSFRVTRFINTNQQRKVEEALQHQQQRRRASQQLEVSKNGILKLVEPATELTGDELHKQNASCSFAGSMYLHYYSDRKGLSPIVKGLVMAVAREFFQTEIQVAEVESSSLPGKVQEHQEAEEEAESLLDADHVVLKIDRRVSNEDSKDQTVEDSKKIEKRSESLEREDARAEAERAGIAKRAANKARQQKQQMLNIYDSLSTNARDSLVSSEIMMQTFPFHVIFDRQFNLVQVGSSLLKVSWHYWQRRKLEGPEGELVKFSDLFQIMRPKIEFTFEAIADHTNQVFVVRTKPNVLNADLKQQQQQQQVRHKRASSGSSHSSASYPAGSASAEMAHFRKPANLARPVCPFDRLAAERRRSNAVENLDCDSASSDLNDLAPSQVDLQLPAANELATEEAANDVSLRLKGQMIILLAGELCLFLCSPRVDHLDQLADCGVNMSDFALHDRSRELMLMSHTHKEDREAVKKLDQASNDLKKMDTKLRQENKRTNEVLHNIFPAKIASLLSHGEKVESESFDLVTCLYSDIIGFTKMCGSENVRPIDIVRLLNTLYLQFDNLTTIHNVFKVETIGDAYVVVGGLPEPAEDHADRCVKMGLDMVKVIATVRSPADRQPIQMRIGIHSGPVMAGIVGIRVPRYSLFGNTTTLANQLETHGVGGKIHISDFTLRNLIKRDKFVVEDNPNQIAGFPFATYFVTDYLKDELETIAHKKILEEQLLKDLELMGNEVELVDDSHYQQQLYACSFDSAGKSALAGATLNLKPENQLDSTGSVNNLEISDQPEATEKPPPEAGEHPLTGAYSTEDKEQAVGTINEEQKITRPAPLLTERLLRNRQDEDRDFGKILMDLEDPVVGLNRISDKLTCRIILDALKATNHAEVPFCELHAGPPNGSHLLGLLELRPLLDEPARNRDKIGRKGKQEDEWEEGQRQSSRQTFRLSLRKPASCQLSSMGPDLAPRCALDELDKQRRPAPEAIQVEVLDCGQSSGRNGASQGQGGARLLEWLSGHLDGLQLQTARESEGPEVVSRRSSVAQANSSSSFSSGLPSYAAEQTSRMAAPRGQYNSIDLNGPANGLGDGRGLDKLASDRLADDDRVAAGKPAKLEMIDCPGDFMEQIGSRRRFSVEQMLTQMRNQVKSLEEALNRLEAVTGEEQQPPPPPPPHPPDRSSRDLFISKQFDINKLPTTELARPTKGGARELPGPKRGGGGSSQDHQQRVCVNQELSSKMRQMKRMDTLKRRKLERHSDSSSRGAETELDEESNSESSPAASGGGGGELFALCQQQEQLSRACQKQQQQQQAGLEPFNEYEEEQEQEDEEIEGEFESEEATIYVDIEPASLRKVAERRSAQRQTTKYNADNNRPKLEPVCPPVAAAAATSGQEHQPHGWKPAQAIRNSLANIMNDVTSQVTVRGKKFSMGSISTIFSLSPSKRNPVPKPEPTNQQKQIRKEEQRRGAPGRNSTGSNCSCLRSSESNQSFVTTERSRRKDVLASSK